MKIQFMNWVNDRDGPHNIHDFVISPYANGFSAIERIDMYAIRNQIYKILIDEFCPFKFLWGNEIDELPEIDDLDDRTEYIYAITNGELRGHMRSNMAGFFRDKILHINDKKMATMLVIAGYKRIEDE